MTSAGQNIPGGPKPPHPSFPTMGSVNKGVNVPPAIAEQRSRGFSISDVVLPSLTPDGELDIPGGESSSHDQDKESSNGKWFWAQFIAVATMVLGWMNINIGVIKDNKTLKDSKDNELRMFINACESNANDFAGQARELSTDYTDAKDKLPRGFLKFFENIDSLICEQVRSSKHFRAVQTHLAENRRKRSGKFSANGVTYSEEDIKILTSAPNTVQKLVNLKIKFEAALNSVISEKLKASCGSYLLQNNFTVLTIDPVTRKAGFEGPTYRGPGIDVHPETFSKFIMDRYPNFLNVKEEIFHGIERCPSVTPVLQIDIGTFLDNLVKLHVKEFLDEHARISEAQLQTQEQQGGSAKCEGDPSLVSSGSINLTDQGQLPENFGTIPGRETSESSSKLDSSPKGLIAPSLNKLKNLFLIYLTIYNIQSW